jgi:hypothetical protein
VQWLPWVGLFLTTLLFVLQLLDAFKNSLTASIIAASILALQLSELAIVVPFGQSPTMFGGGELLLLLVLVDALLSSSILDDAVLLWTVLEMIVSVLQLAVEIKLPSVIEDKSFGSLSNKINSASYFFSL